ncbi:zinc finger, CCHC-type containing protein [Tanacetum coccineum]
MGDENSNRPCTLGDYSQPSHEGYRNAIELPEGANVSPLRSDTIRHEGYRDAIELPEEAKFSPPGRTAKLQKDILMFQQHQDESLCNAWTHFKDLLQKVSHYGLDLWLQVQIFYDHVDYTTQMAIDYAAGGRLKKIKAEKKHEKPSKGI